MPEVPVPAPGKSKQRLLLVWAIVATFAAVVFANVALLLFVRTRELKQAPRSTPMTLSQGNTASPFLSLRENEVPGRYRFFENGEEIGIMTFTPDHKYINKDGTTYPQYRWAILRDGLMICWQRSHTIFTEIERPGVYVAHTPKHQRLEKIIE
jgi:hypothetical protein